MAHRDPRVKGIMVGIAQRGVIGGAILLGNGGQCIRTLCQCGIAGQDVMIDHIAQNGGAYLGRSTQWCAEKTKGEDQFFHVTNFPDSGSKHHGLRVACQ